MDLENYLASENRHYRNTPFLLGVEVTSYSASAIGSDAIVGSSIAPSSPVLSTCSESVYSTASPKQSHTIENNGMPSSLAHVNSARSSQKLASFDRPQVQAQAAYLETTVGKLRTELARVRDSTSITDLSNSRLSLSSIERDLSTKFELPNTKYRHVSRHFTQLQGVYGKAFSDISKAASAEAGPRSDLNSIQLTLESSIDPIAEEYESFILSLEAQLDTIGATPTKRTAKTEAVPTGMNVISLAGSQFYPSANRKELSDRKAERISQTASSEAAIKDVRMSNGFRLDDGESQAPGGKGEKERPRDLAKALEQSEPGRGKTLPDANATQLKSLRENQGDGRLLSSFQELQIRHATTVDELEQIRTQYLNTLKELDEVTARHEEAQRRQRSPSMFRRPALAHLTMNSYSTPSSTSATVPSSPGPITTRRTPVYNGNLPLVSRRSGRPAYSESPKEDLAQKEEILETINVNDHSEQSRLQENSAQLSSDGRSNRSLSVRKSTNVTSVGPTKRAYSNSRTPSLQPLNLPLIRSSSLSLSQYSALRGYGKSPNSPANSYSVEGSSSPLMLDFPNEQQTPRNAERSHESLEKEVLQLQEVLKEREEEIRELELTVRQATSLSESVASLKSEFNDDQSSLNGYTRVSVSQMPRNCNVKGRQSMAPSGSFNMQGNKEDNHPLPGVSCVVEFSQKPFSNTNRNELAISDNIKSLNVLMRSMAKKETDFLETIKNLKSQLKSTERKNEDLAKLSADQMANMSSEIEGLHDRLKISQAINPEVSSEKLQEQASNGEQLRQSEIQALKDEQELQLEKLKTERSENFNQLFTFTNDKLMAKEEQLIQLEARWQATLKAELTAQADFIWAESDNQQSNLVKAQLKSFQAKSSRERDKFNHEIDQLTKKHKEEIERLREEMATKLNSAEARFANRIQEFEQLHAQKAAQVTSIMPSDTRKMTASSDGASQDHLEEFQPWHVEKNQLVSRNYELENEKLYLVSEHEMRLEQLKAEHAREISALQADNDDTLIAALSELDQRRTNKFQAQVKMMEEAHVMQINEIKRIYEQKLGIPTTKEKKRAYQPHDASKHSDPADVRSVESPDHCSNSDSSSASAEEQSTIDTAVLDPRMLKKIEDQDSAISKLTKQLAQCEGNLKANISAIAQLEDALNDTERNLRKSRLQMNGLVQERDKMSIVNQRLRMELLRSQAEVEQIKQGLQAEKQQLESKLEEEKLAKEAARTLLETRMLEMEKSQGKKSKFNCF
ncbi:hypothetical protein PTTG_01854 [Puccinia triticina 1-1 BBBD Race 1]|uniref:Uncharacterized protein n=2 Tax=Puccinia triticina TaxID=208348 RepID=A0A180G9R8_PUCT1|nr:uncharacterized protein PtA15_11A545 [Puccinia triticina]OAV89238.1 hypothetical protein PTTG_01854 [Puccinia triticina 1-1 BBBD Race 1]WAQ89853.1 hypothetical protein PtA15_11A545 [Puccinia triticina]